MARQSSQPSTACGNSLIWTWSRCVHGMTVSSDRQRDVEGGPPGLGVERERAVVAGADEAAGRGEPQPAPAPDVLGRVERVEDPVARFGRDARAVVADVDQRARVLA